jgi:uncharacterized protein YbjT (DUF2867 family)
VAYEVRRRQLVQASGLAWTVIRCAAFMEWCLDFLAVPLWTTGHTRIYGRGDNPINFVSAHDVARVVELAVTDPALRNARLSVAGPENLSFNEVVRRIRADTGSAGRARHVPLPMLWTMWTLMSTFRPALAREIRAGIFLDTADPHRRHIITASGVPIGADHLDERGLAPIDALRIEVG